MKEFIKKLLVVSILFILPSNVYAISVNIKCSAPGTVNVGETFNVTISGSADISTYWNGSVVNSSSNLRSNSGTGSFVEQNSTTSISKTYSFTALSEGTATISQSMTVSDENYNEKSFTSNTCNIKIVKPSSSSGSSSKSNNSTSKNTTQKEKSSDNTLKTLSVEGVKINPEFNKDTLEYTVDLSSDTTKIKIIAEKNDNTATVSGDGELEVKEGQNTFNIVVTAENGEQRIYKIIAVVSENDPITVKIGNKTYTVLKKLTGIETPTSFEKSTIKINNIEVECFKNNNIDKNLVALKDSIGNISFYIYDNDKYTKYSPISSENIKIIVLTPKSSEIPHNYKKVEFDYDNQKIIGYALDKNSSFRLIYGINVEDGVQGFYLYDLTQNTLQRFYNDQVNAYISLVDKCKIAFIILGSALLLLTIIIIILLSKNNKIKKKYIERRLNKTDNPIKYQDIEDKNDVKLIEKKKEKTFLDE